MQKALCLEPFASKVYKKCQCCGCVRNLYYRLDVRDAKTATSLVGSFELCQDCGENFGSLLDQNFQPMPGRRKECEFNFD